MSYSQRESSSRGNRGWDFDFINYDTFTTIGLYTSCVHWSKERTQKVLDTFVFENLYVVVYDGKKLDLVQTTDKGLLRVENQPQL